MPRQTDTTWRELITREMACHGDSWGLVESIAVTKPGDSWEGIPAQELLGSELQAELDRGFYSGFGRPEGAWFTVWTSARVYFPVVYDGAEECASVSRHPDGIATEHIGGW